MNAAAQKIEAETEAETEATDNDIGMLPPALDVAPSVDEPAEQHEKADAETCGATARFTGEQIRCGLAALHGGMHRAGGRIWRPRSGDES